MAGDRTVRHDSLRLPTTSFLDSRSVTTKAGAIIQSFIGRPSQTVTQVAHRVHLPLSTVHRLMQELVSCGLLQRGEDCHYRPGAVLRQIGRSKNPASEALVWISEVLDLALATGHRTPFGVLCGYELGVSYIERPGGDWQNECLRGPSLLPAHATALGKALLAHAPPRTVSRLTQWGLTSYAPHTVTTKEDLRDALSATLKRGMAVSHGEWLEPDLVSRDLASFTWRCCPPAS
jgi:DNA-binding IclR family transcriptional regulator